jgi:AraC-like DNA-binding protein
MSDDSAKVNSYSVDLSALSPGQLRERYHERVGGAWRAEFTDGGAGLAFESTVWNLGAMVVARNAFPARHVIRTRERARVDQLDHYHLQVASATLRIDANGERLSVPAGAPLFLDLSQPADMQNDAGQSIQVFIPRDALDELLPGPLALHAASPQGATAGLVADLMRSLVGRLPTMTIAEGNDAAKATMQLIAASVAPTPRTLERARPALEASLLRQACRYIELHLEDPALGPLSICNALRISRASLYRLFESYGGVATHVMERRLHRIHETISHREQRRPLARIAEEHGFKSAAHFSRAFRQQFGYTPSEVRASGNPAATTAMVNGASPADLSAWLRPLRG